MLINFSGQPGASSRPPLAAAASHHGGTSPAPGQREAAATAAPATAATASANPQPAAAGGTGSTPTSTSSPVKNSRGQETPGGPTHAPIGKVPPPTNSHPPGTSSQHHRRTQCPKTAALVGTPSAAQHKRQASDSGHIQERVAGLAAIVNDLKGAATSHAEALAALDSLERRIAALAQQPRDGTAACDGDDSRAYEPPAAPRWWKLDGPERDQAIAKLRAWVEQVYRPGYGHLAAGLGECWEQHPLCLYVLDWLSELWSVLYLKPGRTAGTLAGQAEWHTRLLTAAAEQLARETRGCRHPAARYPAADRTRARP